MSLSPDHPLALPPAKPKLSAEVRRARTPTSAGVSLEAFEKVRNFEVP
jgi:hypothetical protein